MPDRAFEQLESRRLVLRRFADSDTEPFLAYRSDPETRRYQGWGEYTLEDAVRFVAGLRALHPDTPGRGFQFAIELNVNHEMIGDVYLFTLREKPDQAEIGFTLEGVIGVEGTPPRPYSGCWSTLSRRSANTGSWRAPCVTTPDRSPFSSV